MDRNISYYGALVRVLDGLNLGRQAMIGIGKLAEAVFGTGTTVSGFTCVPTAPASLAVSLTAGQVYQVANLEASAISLLTQDTRSIVKQGIMLDATSLTLTPPTTPGYAQNVLIEVQYADSDSDTLLLNYYNSATPSVPLTGPGGNGIAQATTRKGIVAVQTKYGVAATSGTQVTPTADAGWAPLYVVTLAYGQTAITAGNIAIHPSAPYLSRNLSQITSAPTNTVSFTAAGSGSFTVPAGVFRVLAACVGGGGGGSGTSSSATTSGGAGGAGGTAQGWLSVTPGQVIPYVVGAAGAGTSYAISSGAGGTSSIGTVLTATGGGGTAGYGACAGGGGGTGSGSAATTTLVGGAGNDGNPYSTNSPGGQGGSSSLGGGGRTATTAATVTNGQAPGSGGGGLYTTSTGNGGNGAPGSVSFSY